MKEELKLILATENDAELIQRLKYEAFLPLYNKYHDDETSHARKWRLDTILQEKANCHLYEKCGFIRVGAEKVINESMTLIDYEKIVEK